MPLPVGTWSINANGQAGTLVVGSTSPGTFNGTLFGQPLAGIFDESDQEFTFIRVMSADVSVFEVYRGTLLPFSASISTVVQTLAGEFRQFPATGSAAPRPWSAQLSQKLKEKEGKDHKDKEVNKDNKDGKDRKDGKDNKDDSKESGKELENQPFGPMPDATRLLEQLAVRMNALEQQIAVGRSFISPTERPVVGAQASGDEPPS